MFAAVLLLFMTAGCGCGKVSFTIPGSCLVAHSGMPVIDKWMLQSDGDAANFINQKYNGKLLQEPINVIVIDSYATSLADAETRLRNSFAKAGYRIRLVHSAGYKGYIGGIIFNQQPGIGAFSNDYWFLPNNHGRAFGPYYYQGRYYTIAAFSREKLSFSTRGIPYHQWVSFNMARDNLAEQCITKAGYAQLPSINLQNKIPASDPRLTTGDNDGMAIVLAAAR